MESIMHTHEKDQIWSKEEYGKWTPIKCLATKQVRILALTSVTTSGKEYFSVFVK